MTNAGCLMRKSAARETKILFRNRILSVCVHDRDAVCLGMWIYISVHNCTHSVSVSLTAQALSSIAFFVTLPQASHRCSPVHQVLSTRSVNINKKNPPSLRCQLLPWLGRQPCKCRPYTNSLQSPARPGPAACQPADR